MIVAIVLGGCAVLSVVVIAVVAALLFPVFAQAREAARKASCFSNGKQLGISIQMYVQDYDETYPAAKEWETAIQPYVKVDAEFYCPSRRETVPGYAYNEWLNQRTLGKIENPDDTPVIFDSTLGQKNGHDQLQSFVAPHPGTQKVGMVGLLDGRVKGLTKAPAMDGSTPVSSPQ